MEGPMIPSQRQEQTLRPDLFTLEKKVHMATDLFCSMLWQNSSIDIRAKYRRFHFSKRELKIQTDEYDAYAEKGNVFELGIFYNQILDPIWEMFPLPQNLFDDDCSADTSLTIASFTGCRLGGVASSGDIEFFLRIHNLKKIQNSFARGCFRELRMNLNKRLARASAKIRRIECLNVNRNKVAHAPSIWYETSNRDFVVDQEILETQYHLYMSLLRYVEGISGSA
jgi:hypothetical protein